MSRPQALAIVAHPDDIEFTMAGTMLLLQDKGFDLHFWNLANGCYGSMVHGRADITRIRAGEAAAAYGGTLQRFTRHLIFVKPDLIIVNDQLAAPAPAAFEWHLHAPLAFARGDSGTVTSSLIPWNSCGAYMAATLGVATVHYAPYALFNILSPIITVISAYAGWRMIRIDPAGESSS